MQIKAGKIIFSLELYRKIFENLLSKHEFDAETYFACCNN